jgi:hypothetical protein
MGTVHEQSTRCKSSSERFTALLPHFLTVLEWEWRRGRSVMTQQRQLLFRQAHQALGRLADLETEQ